jgi:iron uptake system component EfeO
MALWKTRRLTSADMKIADRLRADVRSLRDSVKNEDIGILDIATGAKSLLSEIADSKMTGEEDIYSKTDVSDFAANVEGARKALSLLRPLVARQDTDIADRVDQAASKLSDELGRHRDSTGWKSYDKLTGRDKKELQRVLHALAELVSRIQPYLVPQRARSGAPAPAPSGMRT